ncbi:aspartate aminotransferase family protein [uncultured Cocleimonas sp.]|uniref:aminotransferase family protein n=1 Tax=uncultured Cocleimonas sp. TaxID=1051587 RepID=UPI002639F40A|nr:aspartate aminotransferase family protein [uncultured Cocleimonas sp.]
MEKDKTENLMADSYSPLFYQTDVELPLVAKAEGCRIWDTEGNVYIDGCSGAISVNMGHNHAGIKRAIQEQMDKVSFTYRTQFESQVAIDLAYKLVGLANNKLDKVYFVGSGSEAVESALKLAIQYYYATGQKQRSRFVSLRPSYHGSTLGALSVTAYTPLEKPFEAVTQKSIHIEGPSYYRKKEDSDDAHDDEMLRLARKAIFEEGGDTVAGIIVEPIGGASTGARVLSKRYLSGLRNLCDEIGALLIMDEVMTGAGRTGVWYCWQSVDVVPDIMALAKGLGAGYYPVGAMLAKSKITDAVMNSGGFMHGHTYAGNPLACATAIGVLNAMEHENILDNVRRQGGKLKAQLLELQQRHSIIGDVRGEGLLLAMEFVQDQATKEPFPAELNVFSIVTTEAKAQGLLVYPRRCLDGTKGDHILITPPLILDDEIRNEIVQKLDVALRNTQDFLEKH